MNTVTVKDNGANTLMARLEKSRQGLSTKVGVIGPSAGASHDGESITTVEIASAHEFGLGVPERSFIRAWVDENKPKIQKNLQVVMASIVKDNADPGVAMERFGLWAVAQIQDRMRQGIPGKPSGDPRQLKDTGQLVSSILSELQR